MEPGGHLAQHFWLTDPRQSATPPNTTVTHAPPLDSHSFVPAPPFSLQSQEINPISERAGDVLKRGVGEETASMNSTWRAESPRVFNVLKFKLRRHQLHGASLADERI